MEDHPSVQLPAAGFTRWLPFFLFYSVLANLPYLAASHWLGILRNGWFSLDYLAIGLIALYAPRFVAPLLLLIAMVLDMAESISETYFLPIKQCFTNLDALREFPGSRIWGIAAVTLLTLCVVAAAPFLVPGNRKRSRRGAAVCLLLFAVLCMSVDGIHGFLSSGRLPGLFQPARWTKEAALPATARITRMPALRVMRAIVFPPPAGFPMQSASAFVLGQFGPIATGGHESPNLVVILVESWGLLAEAPLRDALVKPYHEPTVTARYKVLEGTVPFYGSTVAGEARELCGSTMGFNIMASSAKQLSDCLPDRMDALGYRSVALHGMTGDFFGRSAWYKTIGFQEIWFHDRFQQQGMPTCPGPFYGTCDASIAEWMTRRLAEDENKPKPDFLYWVTLNSHLPVIVPAPLKDGADCSFAASLREQPQLCSWYQLVANVHASAAWLAASASGRPTIFVIVGDHAPPFDNAGLRARFSPSVVPYVALLPRADSFIRIHAGK